MAAPAAINDDEKRNEMVRTARNFSDYLLARNPFIKMLGVSGSLSNPDSVHHDDIDFFVITRKDKVWDCFTLCLLSGWLYCQKIKKPRTFLCFNYLIDETCAVGEIERNPQAAREYLNLIVIQGYETYQQILAQKKEISDLYPVEYRIRMEEKFQKKQHAARSFQPAVLLLKPVVMITAKWLEKGRKRRYARRPGYTITKIYSNKRVIRSNFY